MQKEQIERSILIFFGDTSRSAAETKEALEELAELCKELAETIDVE